MKKINFIIPFIFLSLSFSGCTNDFDELNTDTTVLTSETIDQNTIGRFFTQTQYSALLHTPIGPAQFNPFNFQTAQALFPDLYVQYFATTVNYFPSDTNIIVGGWNGATWAQFYGVSAPQIKFFEDFTAENNLPNENAIGKIWKTFAYNRMTTFYGPIPFSEFGNGQNSVAYDSQESIYRAAFTTLDEVVAVLRNNTSGTTILGSDDGIYGGDSNKWLIFANTLRLRLAIHIKYVEPALAQSEAEKAVADGVMETNADNAYLLTNSDTHNGYNIISQWNEFRMSAAMESVLKGYEDPRMPVYFSPAANGDSDGDGVVYEGLRNGQNITDRGDAALDLAGSNSNMGSRWLVENLADNTPIRVMRAAEAYFLRAEGALDGWSMGGTAESLYQSGIAMSLEENGVTNAAYATSTNTPAPVGDSFSTPALSDIPVKFDLAGSNERKLEQIMTQKWLALYPDSWESWNDVRRTGYPKLYPKLVSANPNIPVDLVMRRLTYVSSEYDTNGEAVAAALGLSEMAGGDKGSTKLWWDKK